MEASICEIWGLFRRCLIFFKGLEEKLKDLFLFSKKRRKHQAIQVARNEWVGTCSIKIDFSQVLQPLEACISCEGVFITMAEAR
jgi:hypothetical protein